MPSLPDIELVCYMDACLACVEDNALFDNYLLRSMQVVMSESVLSVLL
jgi:hypothetical protein